jgi:hypothetical protein
MKPTHHFSVRVVTEVTSRGPSGTAIEVMGRILRVIHGAAAKANITFASAFPEARTGDIKHHPGTTIRIFAGSRDDADVLADAVEASSLLMDYVSLGRVKAVPAGIETSVSYPYFRIGSAASSARNPERRFRRLQAGDRLPYLKMGSSSGEQFSLRFDVVRQEGAASEEVFPNGYGLSVSSKPFSLPDIPSENPAWKSQVH